MFPDPLYLCAVYHRVLYGDPGSPLTLVGFVTTPDPEEAFTRTNHGVRADGWPHNAGVIPCDPDPRSSGVGDVFVGPEGAVAYRGVGTSRADLPVRAVNVSVVLLSPVQATTTEARLYVLAQPTDEALEALLAQPNVAQRLSRELTGQRRCSGTPLVQVHGALKQAVKVLRGLRPPLGLQALLATLPARNSQVEAVHAGLLISGVAHNEETRALAQAVVDARGLRLLPDQGTGAPCLEAWDFVHTEGQLRLTGRLHGHPGVPDGVVTTTPVEHLNLTAARTASLVYALGTAGTAASAAHLRTLLQLLKAEARCP
ncbi:hypothetical protein [Deinococcus aluminii]|uniref:Uncharacterized protein n=1 Tax=Deinococcus aluminii TaxID=1656885 RepID=A0ABP9XEU9_9DEIO